MGLFSNIMEGVQTAFTGIGTLFGIGGGVKQREIDASNLALQKDQFEYKKGLQQVMFGREDNAVQRRALDLEKAGLSKTLAAGGGAQAGPVVQTQAPQESSEGVKALSQMPQQVAALIQQTKNIAQTTQNTKLAAAQTRKTEAEKNFMNANNPALITQNKVKAQWASIMAKNNIKQQLINIRKSTYQATLNQYTIDNVLEKRIGLEIQNKIKGVELSSKQYDLLIKSLAYQLGSAVTGIDAGVSDPLNVGGVTNSAIQEIAGKLREFMQRGADR